MPAWIAGVLAVAVLTVGVFWNHIPPLPADQFLLLTFDRPHSGASEPIIVTGQPGDGAFLYVRYLDEHTLVFGYDQWGRGGPVSRPVPFSPGVPQTLELALPSLPRVHANPSPPKERLRVVFNGQILIDQPMGANLRRPTHAWFGRNPLGGSACGREFSGRITDRQGWTREGNVRELLTRSERFAGWLTYARGQVGCVLVAGFLVTWFWRRAAGIGLREVRQGLAIAGGALVAHRAFVLTALVCGTAFTGLVSAGSWQLRFRDNFGDFYDYQAMSLLDGRLDVPLEAIGNEAFNYNGRHYGYFGITPALLRLPGVIFGVGFGESTRFALVTYHAACLVAAYLLLLDALRRRPPPLPRRPTWLVVLFTLNLGLGSTLFFLGSRAYVYHEAILCGAAFALWGCWCAWRHFFQPESRWWIGALVCGVLAVHARPPGGLFCLTLLGCIGAFLAWGARAARRAAARHLAIGALTVAGALSFNGLSYLKFGTFNGWPVRLNVQYDARRLAHIDGRQFHLSNVPFTIHTYLLSPNFRIEPRFPWLFLATSKPGREFPSARMDYAESTLALPFGMTGLFLLATVGPALAARRPESRRQILLVGLAVIPMAAVMFTAVVIAQRYTADFCAPLVCGAALGAPALLGLPRIARVALGTVLAVATAWALALTLAVSLHYQGALIWGVPDGVQQRYQHLQRSVDAAFGRPEGAASAP